MSSLGMYDMKFMKSVLFGLERKGLDVSECVDFAVAEDRMLRIGKPGFTPMLSSEFHDFSKDDAAWLLLQKGGKDVAGAAARCDNLSSESLSEYWERSHRRLYRTAPNWRSHTHAPQTVENISGKVVYAGEFFFNKDARGSRNTLTLFSHILFCYCMLRWDPDWIYAFIRKEDVRKGYAAEYGFTLMMPSAQIWVQPPPGRKQGEYLVALSRQDFHHMARSYASKPDLLLGEDSLIKVE